MIKIYHICEDNFKAVVTLPRFMQLKYGEKLEIPFQVKEDRRHRQSSLLWRNDKEAVITDKCPQIHAVTSF